MLEYVKKEVLMFLMYQIKCLRTFYSKLIAEIDNDNLKYHQLEMENLLDKFILWSVSQI